MWLDPQVSSLIGGIAGASIGVCGGVWGAMAGIFARKGKFKKPILTFAVILIVFGAASFCAGIIALLTHQPYHVWYLLLIIGVIVTACVLPGYMNVKKIYTRAELNKMSAEDLS